MKTIKRYGTVFVVCLLASFIGLQALRSRTSSVAAVEEQQAVETQPTPEMKAIATKAPQPTAATKQQSNAAGQSERTFTVKMARYVADGRKIMAKSEVSIRSGSDGAWTEMPGTITVFFPSELWAKQGVKKALVGKTVRFTGVLDLPKVDGEESNTMFATSLFVIE